MPDVSHSTGEKRASDLRDEIAKAIALRFGITKFHPSDSVGVVYNAADAVLDVLREREQPKDAPGIRRFARDVLEGGFEGNTFDGADLQELGVKHGLLREVTVTEPCSTDGCACAEVVDFPTTCYRFTEVMQPPKATEQANSRITQEQFSQIVGEMSTYDFVNGTLDVEAVFNGAGVEIV